MMGFLSIIGGFFSGNKLMLMIIAGVGIAGVIGWLWISRANLQDDLTEAQITIGRLSEQRDRAVGIANENVAAIEALRSNHQLTLKAVVVERDALAARTDTVRYIIKEIENAGPEADGPVADVLRNAIIRADELRQPTTQGNIDRENTDRAH